ncbi:MAG: ATP-binding protein [Phycisphaeraceae bacterium]|nr:ATP-binding protein [Phycisphaeraceae bacterium]
MLILNILKGPDKGKTFELPDDEPQQIGRSGESLKIHDRTISRRHAELTPDEGEWFITDLDSANGTFVNGRRVTERRRLETGDQIRTGNTIILFGRSSEEAATKESSVRVAQHTELDTSVEASVEANEDSMVMSVPDPGEAQAIQLKVLYEMASLLGNTDNQQELLSRAMDVVFENFNADRGFILLQEDPEAQPDPAVVRHRDPPEDNEGEGDKIMVSRTIVQHVMTRSVGILSSNAVNDSRFASSDSVQSMGIRSALCVPIRTRDRLFGVIYVDSLMANYTFTEDQLRLLTAIGILTGMSLANAQLYAQRLEQERLAAVGQTVASLSHSIKNIIQGLRGGAEVVELGIRKKKLDVISNGWDIVARNLSRIQNLTLNMLAFSKQRSPEVELANVEHLVEDVSELVQKQFEDEEVALIVDIAQDLPPIPMDTNGIHQALLNLLNNALDACESGTGAVTLAANIDEEGQVLRLRVTDNGEGIDEERQANLFQPFYSTKGLRGTGLGLVVTQKIVEEHGGELHIESEPEEGTTITMDLPTGGKKHRKGGTAGPKVSTEEDGEDDLIDPGETLIA